MKLGMYIMTPEPISTAYFINPSHESLCLYVYPPIVASQLLGKNITVATNAQATIEEWLNALFLCGPRHIKEKQAISSSRNF
jgi:hypothetical protein